MQNKMNFLKVQSLPLMESIFDYLIKLRFTEDVRHNFCTNYKGYQLKALYSIKLVIYESEIINYFSRESKRHSVCLMFC